MACACEVKNFAKAVGAREVRPDVMVQHSKGSQAVDLLCAKLYSVKITWFGQSLVSMYQFDRFRNHMQRYGRFWAHHMNEFRFFMPKTPHFQNHFVSET